MFIAQGCSVLSGNVWGHACPIYSATDYRISPLLSAVLRSVELHVGTCPILSGPEYRTCPFLSAVLCSVELCGDMYMCMSYMYIQYN